ncbi:MAG TPA: RNA-binding domain-containing protein, partial [bacterium]|nr:RNA-binding domain-containing protein [bacterium]
MEEIVQQILDIPAENMTLEFKRLAGDGVVSKCVETITAFANTEGGVLILGVDDPEKTKLKGVKRIYGIEEHLENYDAIGRELQRVIPSMVGVWPPAKFAVAEAEGRTIGLVHVPKAAQQFYVCNNRVYVRQEKGNKPPLTPQEIVKLSYAKGFVFADGELVDVSFELFETESYKTWRRNRGQTTDIKTEQDLLEVGLARRHTDGKIQPTRAAVMLFCNHPTYLMETKCAIRVFQYEGTIEKIAEVPNLISTPKTLEGPIIKLIQDAHAYVLSLLRDGVRLASGFVNKYQIPERAITEAITNAVIHRDYHLQRDIEVNLFEDRIEIESPGLLP